MCGGDGYGVGRGRRVEGMGMEVEGADVWRGWGGRNRCVEGVGLEGVDE